MRPDNTHHLLAAAQRRRDSALERAQRTLRELRRNRLSATRSPTSPPAPASPAPGSTPKPGYATRSANSLDQRPTSPPVVDPTTQRSSDASLRQRLTLAHARIT